MFKDLNCIKEINLNNGLTHSETLMPLIKQILEETNLKLTDINLLISDIGPGSFTGIRIGIATTKAFADSLNIKAIGINSLEGLCYNVKETGIFCSLIDAKKDNVYVQIFENINETYIIRRNPSFENIDEFLLSLKKLKPEYSITFVGDGAITYKDKILQTFADSKFCSINELSAKNFALAGICHYEDQTYLNLEPLYLRKSQAEQVLEEKQNGTK